MFKSPRKVYVFYFLIDLIGLFLCFSITYLLRYNSFENVFVNPRLPNLREYSFIFSLWYVLLSFYFAKKGLYTTDRSLSFFKEAFRTFIAVLYIGVLVGATIFFAQYKFFSRQVFFVSFVLVCVFTVLWRLIKRIVVRRLIYKGFHNINVLMLGAGRNARMVLDEIKRNPWWGFRVVGFLDNDKEGYVDGLPIFGKFKDFIMYVKKFFVDEIIITKSIDKTVISEIIRCAKDLRIGVRIVPENFEESLEIVRVNYLGFIPLLTYKKRVPHSAEFAAKRFFDFIVSFLLLIFLSPVFLAVMLMIKLGSKGPVFFVQKRVRHKGRIFNLYKFCSMIDGADEIKPLLLKKNEVKGGIIFKMKVDPRVTKGGRFLRRYSLDELPQLINVLKGDMSLVGSRPPTPDEFKQYDYSYMERLAIRPGITGLAQVKGRSNLTFKKWVKWDLWYVNHWSFGLDLMIIRLTLPAVFNKKGAY